MAREMKKQKLTQVGVLLSTVFAQKINEQSFRDKISIKLILSLKTEISLRKLTDLLPLKRPWKPKIQF